MIAERAVKALLLIVSTPVLVAGSDPSPVELFKTDGERRATRLPIGSEWMLGSPPSPPPPSYRVWLPTLVLGWLLANQLAIATAKISAGRQRPYVRPCRGDPDYIGNCGGGRSDNASFYSGHASWSATLAGLLCARHLQRSEVTAVDHLVCGGALGASVATGLLRLTAEEHYAADILAAWGSGALFGYILPVWFDYGIRARRQNLVKQSLQPLMRGNALGLQYSLTC